MIGTSPGIVLSRRPYLEADRLAVVYTPDRGKVTLRFIGVLKSKSKLKALSEPLVRGDYRLHLKAGAGMGRCLGGQLSTVYPGIRADYGRTCAALALCERLERLSAEGSPNPAKFQLLSEALDCLDAGGGPWLGTAFTLRLLDLSGLRPPEPSSSSDRTLWTALLGAPLAGLAALPEEPDRLSAWRSLADRHVEQQLDRPLKTAVFAH